MESDSGVVLGNVYNKYETRNLVARFVVQNYLAALHELISRLDPRRILEVGCGEGYLGKILGEWFPRARVMGIDLSCDLFPAPGARADNLNFAAQSAYQLGFPSASFDLVIAAEVLEHLDDPDLALMEIRRVARSKVLISVPREPLWRCLNLARLTYLRAFGNTPGHVQHWSSGGIRRLMRERFEVLAERRPLPWTMILAQKRGATGQEPAGRPRPRD